MDILRPYLARIIAGLIASGCAWLAAKYGLSITPDIQSHAVEALVGFMLAVFSLLYSFLHKLLDKKINPADSASSHLAAKGLAEHERMAALQDITTPRH